MGDMNNLQLARKARQTIDEFAPAYGREPSAIDATVLICMTMAKDDESAKRMAIEALLMP